MYWILWDEIVWFYGNSHYQYKLLIWKEGYDMTKVITYGTYDLLHYGHIRLLERAKALGDYLVVGITSDAYDKTRGKINNQQTLMERIAAVEATGLADEIVVEEYEGQKIDDIKRLNIDIFTVGSDWEGYFDYLNEFCKVVYLERTEGISSSQIRSQNSSLKIGLLGSSPFLEKVYKESKVVNGGEISGIYSVDLSSVPVSLKNLEFVTDKLDLLLENVDAVYVHSYPAIHYEQITYALNKGKHVLVESPVALSRAQYQELIDLAQQNRVVLMDAIRTAYSTAYNRLLVILQSGKIGDIVSVDATCTSLKSFNDKELDKKWNSITAWGPTALLPVFQILGDSYNEKRIVSRVEQEKKDLKFDTFTKIDFVYNNATASIKVGRGVKSEGELIVSGTKGYAYVPAPWWKTDYFELRYENPADNRRYFYQLDGEGIRYELVSFLQAIRTGKANGPISTMVSKAITGVMEDFLKDNEVTYI